jgi:hypothetical protein
MYRCRWQRHRGALSAISYSHTHAMIVKETRARASISSGQSIKTISSKVFTMSKEYSRSDQFSLTGAATEEDQLLLLALQESASMHQVSIGSEACSKYYQATSRGGIRLLQLPIINQFQILEPSYIKIQHGKCNMRVYGHRVRTFYRVIAKPLGKSRSSKVADEICVIVGACGALDEVYS